MARPQAALAVSNGTDEAASVAAGLIQSLWGALPHGAGERASGLVALLLYTGLPADSDAPQATRLEAARQVRDVICSTLWAQWPRQSA